MVLVIPFGYYLDTMYRRLYIEAPTPRKKRKKERKKENEQTLLFAKEPKCGWVGCGVVVRNFGEIYKPLFYGIFDH